MRAQRVFLAMLAVFLAILFICRQAKIAFTAPGMERLTARMAGSIQWLMGSPDGQRVAAFIMGVVAIVAVTALIKAVVIHNCGGLRAWGSIQVVIGLGLVSGGGFGWHVGQVSLLWAIGMGFVGCVLISKGADNIRLGRWVQFFSS